MKINTQCILNEYQDKLNVITTKLEELEKVYHNLSHLKIKEYNILKGKKSQLVECIETFQKYNTKQ